MRNYRIFLLRHGQTAANEAGVYCGRRSDIALSATGEQQLDVLMDSATYPFADTVYTSPMLRAQQTANILYPEQEPVVLDGLAEADFGRFDGHSLAELQQDDEYCRWVTPGSKFCPDGVEAPADFYRRNVLSIISIIEDMISRRVFSAAVITHAGVIGNILSAVALPKKPPYEWLCAPGEGYSLATSLEMWSRDRLFEVSGTLPLYGDEADGLAGNEDELYYE